MILLVAGESGSGKTTFAEHLKHEVFGDDAVILPMDMFYFGKSQKTRVDGWHNMPSYCDIDRLIEVITCLSNRQQTTMPDYSMSWQDRIGELTINPKSHIIIEGLWALTFRELRAIAQKKIYMEAPSEVRLHRRVVRDGRLRGRSKEETEEIAPVIEALGQQYVVPFREYADEVINTE